MKAPQQLVSLFLMTWASAGLGQDFRVETDVFVKGDKQPVVQTLTIFSGDVVYDFLLGESEDITVFDMKRGRLVLLNVGRKAKTTFTTEELLEFTAAIKATSIQPKQQKFDTEFADQFYESQRKLSIQGQSLSYEAEGIVPKFATAVSQYRRFADWYARLNAVRPGNVPPFGRLHLNRRLADEGLVPLHIIRQFETREVRSHQSFVWLLSTTDRKRIETAGAYLAKFRSMSLADYWKAERQLAVSD